MRSEHTRCWNDRTRKKSGEGQEGVAFDFVVNDPGKRSFDLSGWQPSQNAHLHKIDDRQVTDACHQDGKY